MILRMKKGETVLVECEDNPNKYLEINYDAQTEELEY